MPNSGWDMDLGRLRDLFEREIIGARPEDADRDTPLVPKFCRKKAIMKLVNTVETRLNE